MLSEEREGGKGRGSAHHKCSSEPRFLINTLKSPRRVRVCVIKELLTGKRGMLNFVDSHRQGRRQVISGGGRRGRLTVTILKHLPGEHFKRWVVPCHFIFIRSLDRLGWKMVQRFVYFYTKSMW